MQRVFAYVVVLGLALAAAGAAVESAGAVDVGSERTVRVFTDRNPEFSAFLFRVFQNNTGIVVEPIYGEAEDIEAMLRAGQWPDFDAVLSADAFWVEHLTELDLLAELDPGGLELRIPAALRDPQWRWIGVSQRPRVLHVSSRRLPDGGPATFEDLADPEWRGRICSRSMSHSYSLQMIAAMLNRRGLRQTNAWLHGLAENLAAAPEGDDGSDGRGDDRAQIRHVAEGRCDIAIANADVRGFMQESAVQRPFVDATRVITPHFDGGGAHVALMAAGVFARTGNPGEARAFVDFLVSEVAQRIFMGFDYEHPVLQGMPLEGLVAEWGPLQADALPFDRMAILREQAERLVEGLDAAD